MAVGHLGGGRASFPGTLSADSGANTAITVVLGGAASEQTTSAGTESDRQYVDGVLENQTWKVSSVRVRFSASVGSISIKATLDHGVGANYDVLLLDETFSGQDFEWVPPGDLILGPNTVDGRSARDKLKVVVVAAGSGVTTYVAVNFEVA